MSFNTKYTTSLFGRRFGIQLMTTGESGGSYGPKDFLVGPEALRIGMTTADTTAANLTAYGHSVLTTAASSGVYTLDPPVPGVEKQLTFLTTGANPIYVKTANGEQIGSTQMTTATVICSSQTNLASITLRAISTAAWMAVNSISSAFLKLSTST